MALKSARNSAKYDCGACEHEASFVAPSTMVARWGLSTGSFSGKSVTEPKTSLKSLRITPAAGASGLTSSLILPTRKERRMSAKERETFELARKCWRTVDIAGLTSTRS